MPPKKSEQPRRSDVSTARFEVMEEDAPAPAGPSTEAHPPTTDASFTVADGKAASASGASPGPGNPEKKDKEAEKKDKTDKDAIAIEDLTLPKSIIARLAKGVLPPNTQIQANAIMALNKSATVFISYLASHANENTIDRNKSTIMPDDVFKALQDTEFGFLVEPLKAEYEKFASDKSNKRKSYRASKKSATEGDSQMADVSTNPGGPDDTVMTTASGGPDSASTPIRDEPRAKKAKIGAAVGVGAAAGAAGAAAVAGEDDEDADENETEPEDQTADHDEDDDDAEDDEVEEEEEEENAEETEGEGSQGEEDGVARGEEEDEALDGDESD
ncbi:histone-fold-containing protein [Plectosphaerella plurivora]|uniref:DNA polymerase epsilon subunit D n=1 Tax=Plectosphaerella plurivora TaxID=936078 RepID=A0A9P8VAS2_9PEZI|nr:histone-fold-containing protein [Plectosphaerella plurivora]